MQHANLNAIPVNEIQFILNFNELQKEPICPIFSLNCKNGLGKIDYTFLLKLCFQTIHKKL